MYWIKIHLVFFLIPMSIVPTKSSSAIPNSPRLPADGFQWQHKISGLHIPQPYIYKTSFLTCIKECAVRTSCKSVNYKTKFQLCTVYKDSIGEASARMRSEVGSISSDISNWNLEWIGPCKDISCGPRQKCVENSDSTECRIVECEYPPELLQVADVNITGLTIGSVISYGCLDGSTRTENMQITCQDDGQWSAAIDTTTGCQKCEYPPELLQVNDVYVSGLTVGSVISYGCLDGYTRNTNKQITCQDDGQWSAAIDTTTECQITCPDPGIYTEVERLSFTYMVVPGTGVYQAVAKSRCESSGGTLARIRTAETQNYLVQVLKTCSALRNTDGYWLDGRMNHGTWQFSDGSQMPVRIGTFWANEESREGSTDGCYRADKDNDFLWNDVQCDDKYSYICQKA